MHPAFLATALAIALTGCPNRSDDAGAARAAVIHGSAHYVERIKMPPGADFTVQLIEEGGAGTVIANTTLENVAGPPYDFALAFDPAKVRDDRQYSIDATLRGADGNLLFVTNPRVPVTPGADAPVDVRMTRVRAAGEPAPSPMQVERTLWTCDSMTFEAIFDLAGDRVDLALPEGTLSLPRAQSASGTRYADHRGNEFVAQGHTGTLTREGGGRMDCVRADPPVAVGSPWEKAQQRGIAFRAIGNEPGWLVEVGRGDTPTLHAELDYGERRIHVPQAQTLSGLLGYAGDTDDGTLVRLVLERKACSDGMSDTTYPVEAVLDVDGTIYRGCGRFLD